MEHKLYTAIKALREIRDKQGRVCKEFELCDHISCKSSYASWYIADKALADIEEINKHGCRIYKGISELEVHRFYKRTLQDWLNKGKGIAVYSRLWHPELGKKAVTKKYCSFGTRSSTIPSCDIPPATMPKRYHRSGPSVVYYLVGYIPKTDSKVLSEGTEE